MLRVRDIMTRDVVSLAGDAPLEVAAWRLASEAVSGAPVRDAQGNLIGVLSKSDLVDLMRGPMRGAMRGAGEATRVEDAMTPGVWAVHPDAPALEAVELMVEKCIHRVLVVRGPGKLEGIVTAMDVMRAIAGGNRFHSGGEARRVRERESDENEDEDGEGEGETSRAAASAGQ